MGQVFYRQEIIEGGDFAMISAVPVLSANKRRRRPRCKPTKAAQAYVNKKRAENYFFYLIHENFSLKDNRLGLSFADEYLPKDPEDFKRKMRNFICRLRRRCDKKGVELKLVWIPEISEDGRYHVHGFINGEVSSEDIQEAWKMGYVNVYRFQYEKDGLAAYIHYVFKDPLMVKKWNATKNLKKPKIRKSDYVLRRKDVDAVRRGDLCELEQRLKGWAIIEAREEWEEPTVFDWRAAKAEVKQNPVNDLPYLYIKLYRKGTKFSY